MSEPGLKGFWGFDEGLTSGNTLIDRSPYCHAGTNVGATRVSTGRIGNALSFENNTAHAVIPRVAHLNNLRPMTITGWVKPTAVGPETAESWSTFASNSANAPTSAIIEKDSSAAQSNGWGVYTTANKRLIFWVDCGLTSGGASGKMFKHTVNNTLPLNTWTHFAVVWTGGTSTASAVKLYINGAEASYADTHDCTGTLPNDSGVDIWVGLEKSLLGNNGGTNPTLPFRGMIDDLRIYGKALTASEVGAINAAQCTVTSCNNDDYETALPACTLTGQNVFNLTRTATHVWSTGNEVKETTFAGVPAGTYTLKVQTADGYCNRASTPATEQDYERVKVELYNNTTKVYGPSVATDDLADGVISATKVKDFGTITLDNSVNKLKVLHAYPSDPDPNSVFLRCIQLVPVSTAPSCDTFTVTPTTVTQGSAVNFKWSTSNATQVSIKEGATVVMASSTSVDNTATGQNYTPATVGTHTYTLTGAGTGGSCTKTVTVTVNQSSTPTCSLTANPTTVTSGGSSVFTWAISNLTPTRIEIKNTGTGNVVFTDNTSPAASGTYTLTNITQSGSYRLNTFNSAGTITCQSSIVTVTPGGTTNPTVDLTANPTTVTSGSPTTLSWTSTNANSCSASASPSTSQWTGAKSTSGSVTVNPNAATQYSLTCTGNGTANASDNVTVSISAQCTANDCGNLVCEAPNETSGNCPADCGTGTVQCKPYDCGNGTCETSDGESEANCRADCPQGASCSVGVDCGDGICSINEQATNPSGANYCIADCGTPPTTEGTSGRTATSTEF